MSNLTEAAEGIVANKGELFTSYDVNAFEVPGGRDELPPDRAVHVGEHPERRDRDVQGDLLPPGGDHRGLFESAERHHR